MTTTSSFDPDFVDHRAGRLVALTVAGIMLLGLATSLSVAAAFLSCDFFLRGFVPGGPSPLALVARELCRRLGLSEQPVNAKPKRFSARLGFGMALAIFLTSLAGLHSTAVVLACLLLACAALEGLFSLCAACLIYSLLHRNEAAARDNG